MIWTTSALSLIGAGLLRLGRQDWLAVDWSDPAGWLTATETEAVLAALARLVGLALIGWIGMSTVAYFVVRLLGMPAGAVRWLSIGPFRRAVDALLAGYLMLGALAPVGAATDPGPQAPPSTREAVHPGYIPAPSDVPSRPAQPEPAGPAEKADTEEVEPGDHLWSMSADEMTEVLGRVPTDAEIAAYWAEVVEANRHRIRSGDPDLIFPGEEIVLPPVTTES